MILNKYVLVVLVSVLLVGCRGAEDASVDAPRFPQTPDQNSFVSFLNKAPGVPQNGIVPGEIDNVADFPEAYYNTIDPDNTRDKLTKWQIANGFLNADGSVALCAPINCKSAHVTFRDTKDLGYGRSMFMRWNLDTQDVAIYVENFQVDAVPGVPYGPLNFEALVAGDRSWNFGVNAIEFSAFPGAPGSKQFTKFYNYAGDGKRALRASGEQKHFVDLDNRGDKPMPTPCIVCHGGHGRTLVYKDTNGTKKIAPSITGGVPGDVQAHLQMIEFDTLQFANKPGFTKEDNEDGVRQINEAILNTFLQRQSTFIPGTGDWDPSFAIEILRGRYSGNPADENNRYNPLFVPGGWASRDQELYRSAIGPNCIVCHVLRGSGLNPTASFENPDDFTAHTNRIDHLVYAQGKMPLGLLNYANFWDNNSTKPTALANALGLPERLDENQRAIRPGKAMAVIAAPPVATGLNQAGNEIYDIPIRGSGSAFANSSNFVWSVTPVDQASIAGSQQTAVLRANSAGVYTITLQIRDDADVVLSAASIEITVVEEGSANAPPPAQDISFYAQDSSVFEVLESNCTSCHSPSGDVGIPLYYQACGDPDGKDDYDFLYRSVLARVNFNSPLDSLILRKPTNGSTDISVGNRQRTAIPGYHAGVNALANDSEFSKIVTWILMGAPRGLTPGNVPACS